VCNSFIRKYERHTAEMDVMSKLNVLLVIHNGYRKLSLNWTPSNPDKYVHVYQVLTT